MLLTVSHHLSILESYTCVYSFFLSCYFIDPRLPTYHWPSLTSLTPSLPFCSVYWYSFYLFTFATSTQTKIYSRSGRSLIETRLSYSTPRLLRRSLPSHVSDRALFHSLPQSCGYPAMAWSNKSGEGHPTLRFFFKYRMTLPRGNPSMGSKVSSQPDNPYDITLGFHLLSSFE